MLAVHKHTPQCINIHAHTHICTHICLHTIFLRIPANSFFMPQAGYTQVRIKVLCGNCNPLHYSCLENPRDRGACLVIVHRVAKSQTRLKRLNTQFNKELNEKNQNVFLSQTQPLFVHHFQVLNDPLLPKGLISLSVNHL